MDRNYGGLIWTNHALQRLSERGFPQKLAYSTFTSPAKTLPGRDTGSVEYQRWFGKSKVTVIAKKNDKKEWIILSCWIDPPLPGTEDHEKLQKYRAYQQSTGWKRWLLAILRQFGL